MCGEQLSWKSILINLINFATNWATCAKSSCDGNGEWKWFRGGRMGEVWVIGGLFRVLEVCVEGKIVLSLES